MKTLRSRLGVLHERLGSIKVNDHEQVESRTLESVHENGSIESPIDVEPRCCMQVEVEKRTDDKPCLIDRVHCDEPIVRELVSNDSVDEGSARESSNHEASVSGRKMSFRLRPEVAHEISQLTGRPFTLGAYGDDLPAYPNVKASGNTFLCRSITGEDVFVDPPKGAHDAYIKHCNDSHAESPSTTSCCVIVPAWNKGNYCAESLKGWALLKTYPKRSRLYNMVSGVEKPVAGTNVLVNVWYKPPEATVAKVGPTNRKGRPTFMCKAVVAGASAMVNVGTDHAVDQVLIDTGATDCFVHPEWLSKSGYQFLVKPITQMVKLADLSEKRALGAVELPLKLGQYRGKVKFLVLDIGDYDMILGDNWLESHSAVIDYGRKVCQLRVGPRKVIVRPSESAGVRNKSRPRVSVMTARQARRQLPKAEAVGIIIVSMDLESELAAINTILTEHPHLKDIDDPELRALIEEYIDLFGEIPPHSSRERGIAPMILQEPGAGPQWRPVYKLTLEEREALNQQIKEMIEKGWVEPSSSPYGAPVMFVRKKDGSLRMVIDYRALNRTTIRNRYPLPRIDDLLDIVGKAQFFTSLDLSSGYHQLKINDADVEKTAFRTPIGHYQWRVLSMGLTNAPSVFQMAMNQIFADLVGKSVVVYLDDILIFSDTREEHLRHIRQVLEILQREQLYCKLPKCEFMRREVTYLGHIIDGKGLRPDPRKVEVVKNWPRPTNIHELRGFLGMCNYFRRFIQGYAKKVYPMTELLRKGVWDKGKPDPWTSLQDKSLELIKEALTSAPCLAHYDMSKPVELICDASKVALGGILMQEGQPIAYESRKLSPAETRYSTGDRELLAVIHCLKVWRCYLHGQPFKLITDHKPNTYLRSLENWSDRQARWNEKLEHFSYQWEYRKGEDNIADPLSRLATIVTTNQRVSSNYEVLDRMAWTWRPRDKATEDPLEEFKSVDMESSIAVITRQMVKDIFSETRDEEARPSAPLAGKHTDEAEAKRRERRIRKLLTRAAMQAAYDSEEWRAELSRQAHEYSKRPDGLWYKGDKIAVPPGKAHAELREAIIMEHHDTTFAGHPGFDRLKASIKRNFWWPGLHTEVLKYAADCVNCARNKSSRTQLQGKLQPHAIPDMPWAVISMDFITGLPQTPEGLDTIAVFVDKLTKMVHLHPCSNKTTSSDLVDIFMSEVFRHHGVPLKIISDRDPKIVAQMWREVMKLLGTKCNISTGYHPETDGQTEVYNKVIEEVLRNFVSPTMTNWATLLSACEFALNDHVHSGTKHTPFYLNYGRHPIRPIDLAMRKRLGGEEGKSKDAPTTTESNDPRLIKDSAERVAARERFAKLEEARKRARQLLLDAQSKWVDRENRKRRDVSFVRGDKVWLSSKNFKWKAGTRKLCPRWLGPFEITEVIGPVSYRLELPREWKLHDAFHVSLLKPFLQDATYRSPAPVKVNKDGEPEWEIDEIVKHRRASNKTSSYLVQWKGFGREYQSWQPETNISAKALSAYWEQVRRNPNFGKVVEPTEDETRAVE